eukprot:1562968-Pyramimonas_sp.AAC.1
MLLLILVIILLVLLTLLISVLVLLVCRASPLFATMQSSIGEPSFGFSIGAVASAASAAMHDEDTPREEKVLFGAWLAYIEKASGRGGNAEDMMMVMMILMLMLLMMMRILMLLMVLLVMML